MHGAHASMLQGGTHVWSKDEREREQQVEADVNASRPNQVVFQREGKVRHSCDAPGCCAFD
jgi:hypothetical protein